MKQEKIILIYSESTDSSTNEVIQYLKFISHHKVIRINENTNVSYFFQNKVNNNLHIDVEGYPTFSFSNILSIWFRRTHIYFNNKQIFEVINSSYDKLFSRSINRFLFDENKIYEKTILFNLMKIKRKLGNPLCEELNKIITLELAKKVGLFIPSTYIINCKSNLLNIFRSNPDKEFITKPLSNVIISDNQDFFIENYTKVLSLKDISPKSSKFFSSLLQERIKKKFEIRTIFIFGKLYSMAIFSQKHIETSVDFRNYDSNYINNTAYFKLPGYIEKRIIKLFKLINLNFGAVDLIYSNENKYVFLEINPVGQYDMVAVPCNISLNHEIAKFLCQRKNY